MSWFNNQLDTIKEAATSFGVKDIMSAYVGQEQKRRSSFSDQQAEQTSARFTPEVEAQNLGDPVSIKPQTPAKQLVGEVPKDAAVVDKKLVYIGGSLLALFVVGGLVLALKK